MSKRRRPLTPDEPLRHRDHSKPRTRRDFLRQGFIAGGAYTLGGGVFSLFANPRQAFAAVSGDLGQLASGMTNPCTLAGAAGALPFICFDLAGGANFAGSNVIVGTNSQNIPLSNAGYRKMGLPDAMVPNPSDTTIAGLMQNPSIDAGGAPTDNLTNSQLGLRFHSDSAMLLGIREKFTSLSNIAASGMVDGAVIPARSDNDTGNNPHNPMYGIARAAGMVAGNFEGYTGKVVSLIGSRNSESGGNSMAPASFLNPEIRPAKVDRPSDVTGMVDVGDLTAVLSDPADVTAVMESIARISHKKIRNGTMVPGSGNVTKDEVVKDLLQCGYLKSAHLANEFAGQPVDPQDDPFIANIFTGNDWNDAEFRKTASVMKMVISGYAQAGCITMGGYDYHTGDRATGELRDLRAGRCIGAVLEYAHQKGQAVMIYVFSDGSVASNGRIDDSANGRGKGEWTGDNSSTACSFFLVYDPAAGLSLNIDPNPDPNPNNRTAPFDPRQLGSFSSDGSVVTSASPAANNVNLLVNTVIANYMSLNRNLGDFPSLIPNHGLGTYSRWVSFNRN